MIDGKQQRLKLPSYVSLGRDGKLTLVVEGRALPGGGYLVEQVSEVDTEDRPVLTYRNVRYDVGPAKVEGAESSNPDNDSGGE